MAHRSSSLNAAPLKLSSRTVAIATATATLTAAGALQAFGSDPMYEGSTQLVGILPDSFPSLKSSSGQNVASSHPSLASANIAPPDLIHSVQADVLQDSAMATFVAGKLQKQGLKITPSALLSRIKARTSSEGWLEVYFQDTDPSRVQLVLEQVAQWYATQDSSCDIQACQDVPFIEAQIPILKQRQRQLNQKIGEVNQQLQQSVSHQMDSTIETATIEDYSDYLLVQQHLQIRHLAHVETAVAETLARLKDYQARMNLSTAKVQTRFKLLNQIIPQYQEWSTEWQQGDRQLLALTLSKDSQAQVYRRANGGSAQTTVESDAIAQDSAELETPATAEGALTQKQQALTAKMNQTVSGIVQHSVVDMPGPISELILSDIRRFDQMEGWLMTLHRLQLLERRRQTLKQMQQDTIAQTQEWQQATNVHDQLRQELTITTETLTKYQQHYEIAQQQVAKESLAWQVIAPPEVVQEKGGLSWMLSSLAKTQRPLMTLGLP
ncbi:MAG: hypothetical protein AAGD25_11755 [Cyanobacteria bacterium P01_F01_bin.150]